MNFCKFVGFSGCETGRTFILTQIFPHFFLTNDHFRLFWQLVVTLVKLFKERKGQLCALMGLDMGI